MTNCITYVWRGEARRWLLLGRVPQNVHYDLITYRSPRPCFHVVCLFKISMQASVRSTCNLPLLAARRRYLTDLSNVHVILRCLLIVHGASTLEITCNVMSLPNSTAAAAAAALCPPSREPADGAAQLVHVFISFLFFYSSVPLLCVVWSGQVVHDYKYPYQSNVSKR